MIRETDRQQQAREKAKKAAEKLFGNRPKEQEQALEELKSIGSPDNLVKPDTTGLLQAPIRRASTNTG